MKKTLILATAAIIGGSVLAYAQQPGPGPQRWRPSTADIAAFADARIAALKAGLTLSAEQEKLWPPVENVLRDMAKKRIDRFEKFRAEREKQAGPVDPLARMRRGAESMTERGGDLKRLADASEPLYDKLDEAQKQRFGILMRAGMRGRGMHRFGMHDDGRGWREGRMDRRGHRMGGDDDGGGRGPAPRGGERL